MQLTPLTIGFLAFALSVQAQYFSEGWKPGQPVYATTEGASSEPTFTPNHAAESDQPPNRSPTSSGFFDINRILTSEPIASLFSKIGVNITDRVVNAAKIWDERIPLITDDNFQDLIVNEPLSTQEATDRTWIIVITVAGNGQEGISKYVDQTFDSAFNESMNANDLPNIRWGRIDYLNVTYITTKWNVWQAPYLVVLRDKGQTLRFYRPGHLRLNDEALRDFLRTEGWKSTPPWAGLYSPGGEREYLMDFFATWLTTIYNVTILVPRWILLLVSGGIASLLLNLLHKPSATPVKHTARIDNVKSATEAIEPQDVQSGDSDERAASAPVAKRSSTRQRRVKK